MDVINFNDINLHDFGITIQTAGIVWTGKGHAFITQFPGKSEDVSNLKSMPMDLPSWETLLRQTDLLETEIFALDPSNRIVKAIYRRTQRSIDAFVQWKVFERDHYSCRYCGRTGIPLSVDHIILWEEGGPTIVDNLISACKPCNKNRGNIQYADWLKHPRYLQASSHLPESVKQANEAVLLMLPELEKKKVVHIRTR